MVSECPWLLNTRIIVFFNIKVLICLLLGIASTKRQIVIKLSELVIKFRPREALNRTDNQFIEAQFHVVWLRSPLTCIHYYY